MRTWLNARKETAKGDAMQFEKFEVAEGDEVDKSEAYLGEAECGGSAYDLLRVLAYRDQLVDDIGDAVPWA